MPLDRDDVARVLRLDPAWAATLSETWTRLIALAVLGDLKSGRLGTLPRFRKRVLDLGERLRSLLAGREWIPQPRDQLKNALASALALREALAQVRSCARDLGSGTDLDAFSESLDTFERVLERELESRANTWAALLDRPSEEDDNSSSATEVR